jgi:hypothetical protein
MKNNKLIAEFMGIELDTESYRCGSKMTYEDWLIHSTQKNMRFHISWDWLMPVIEKCLEKHNNLIDGRDVIDTSYSSIAQALQVVSLKETYKAVVEFIKEHNDESRNL